jgi:hypothetical protein
MAELFGETQFFIDACDITSIKKHKERERERASEGEREREKERESARNSMGKTGGFKATILMIRFSRGNRPRFVFCHVLAGWGSAS